MTIQFRRIYMTTQQTAQKSPFRSLREAVFQSKENAGVKIPNDPRKQLWESVYYAAQSLANSAAQRESENGNFNYVAFKRDFAEKYGKPTIPAHLLDPKKVTIKDVIEALEPFIEVGRRCSARVLVSENQLQTMLEINAEDLNRLTIQRMLEKQQKAQPSPQSSELDDDELNDGLGLSTPAEAPRDLTLDLEDENSDPALPVEESDEDGETKV